MKKTTLIVSRELNPFLACGVKISSLSKTARDKLQMWTDPNWTQDEYLAVYHSKGHIDPTTGWAITSEHQLIHHSLGFSRAPHVRQPSLWGTYINKKHITRFGKIFSLRDTGEENYFHFFNDVLPKLLFARENGIELTDYTFIVSKSLSEKEYFKVIRTYSWISKLKFHVQNVDWVQFEEALFCKPLTHSVRFYKEMVRMYRNYQPSKDRRVFIVRSPKTLRYISNLADITPMLNELNFEILDAGNLAFAEQVRIFSESGFVVGVHGAGLTNIIFREGKPLKLLEIAHPFVYIPFHYIMLASILKYEYQVLLGKNEDPRSGGFEVDPKELRKTLEEMIAG
jgi:capsular polysaccharide biosynthesis protein